MKRSARFFGSAPALVASALVASALSGGCGSSATAPNTATAPAAVAKKPRDTSPDPIKLLECDASAVPPRSAVRRLSVLEYQNSLRDLFDSMRDMGGVLDAVAMDLNQLPKDGEARASFSQMDARVSQRHIDTFVKVASGIGQAIAADPKRLRTLAGGCAEAATLDEACFKAFVDDFGTRVLRRHLSDAERERYLKTARAASSPAAAYATAVSEFFAAPDFLYRIERGEGEVSGGLQKLTGYELASRLSYQFWRTTPDDELLRAAASGTLDTEKGYAAAVDRLLDHQRARSTWYRFIREWLRLDEFGGFASDAAFKSFAGDQKADNKLYDDAVWEIEQLAGYFTFETPGRYRDLLTSNLVITRSQPLADLYGVEPWDPRSEPAEFDAEERSGLLTRAALLFTANHATNPFRRGAFVRRQLLCEPIEPPASRPPEAFVVPEFDSHLSTRKRYERKVAAIDCKSCHDLFTPYGYALEGYDALSRRRKDERLIDDAGRYAGDVPIDSRVEIDVGAGKPVEVDGPIALSEALADSPAASECFARQYFRFTFRRMETPADSCTLNDLLSALESGGLPALYRNIAFSKAFKNLSVPSQGDKP